MTQDSEMFPVRVLALMPGGEFVCDPLQPERTASGAKKIFLRNVVPGEEASVRISEEQKNFVRGELIQISSYSEYRKEPPCPYYLLCGGCDLQHIQIDRQRSIKLDMVEQSFRRKAKLSPAQGFHLIGEQLPEFHYRRRLRLKVGPTGSIGFFRRNSHEVVDVSQCLLAEAPLNGLLSRLRELPHELLASGSEFLLETEGEALYLGVHLRENTDSIVTAWKEGLPSLLNSDGVERLRAELIWKSKEIHRFGSTGSSNDIPFGRFSQVNELANELLINTVVGLVETDSVLDLYAGSGNFSFPLVATGKHVEAVEKDSRLTAYARRQIKRLERKRVRFHRSTCEVWLNEHAPQLDTTVILDPPRTGARVVADRLGTEPPARVIYVSCSLPTLLRDIEIMCRGQLELQSVFVLDMFPQTHHVEVIAVLDRS